MAIKKVAVVFGGRSGEHEISLRSAASIMESLKKIGYEVFPVGITRDGTWIAGDDSWQVLWEKRPLQDCQRTAIITDPANPGFLLWEETGGARSNFNWVTVDVVFPVLHGPFGEDGTIQGVLEMAGLPFVGAGVLASVAGMDKVLMKEVFCQKGLPVGDFIHFKANSWRQEASKWMAKVEAEIGFPCFVKPANLGSSVGISKAYDGEQLQEAVEEALLYDEKVVVEAFISGKEIECSVLGDLDLSASIPGEIVPSNDFYDYYAKYIDDRSELIIPAQLSDDIVKHIQELAVNAFKVIDGSGMCRVDFFVEPATQDVFINEVNTIPGFTSISMYPKLWEASGVSFTELVDKLLQIAWQRHKRRQKLKNSPPV